LVVNKKDFLARVLKAQPKAALECRNRTAKKQQTPSSKRPGSDPETAISNEEAEQYLKDAMLEKMNEPLLKPIPDTFRKMLREYQGYDHLPMEIKYGNPKFDPPPPPELPKGGREETRYTMAEMEQELDKARAEGDRDKEEWYKERMRLARRRSPEKDGKYRMPEPPPNKVHPRDLLDKLPSDVQTAMLKNLPDHEWVKLGQTWELVRNFDKESRDGFLKELERQVRSKMLAKELPF
jgi:hypothetical protein